MIKDPIIVRSRLKPRKQDGTREASLVEVVRAEGSQNPTQRR